LVNYINSQTKIDIICRIHGVFRQIPHSHLLGIGCAKCGFEKNSITQRKSVKQYIDDANEIHNGKYDYSLVEYRNNGTKIKIICPIHGVFSQNASDHLSGSGCRKCAGYDKTTEEFIQQAKLIHDEKYNYSLVNYVDARTKVAIICDKHDVFFQSAYVHLGGQGCPKCKSSKGERKIQKYLDENNIQYNYQHKFKNSSIKRLKFDFYLPPYRLLIEFNGGQHYESVKHWGGIKDYNKRKNRDNKKKAFAKRNHYHFLEIPYFSKNPTKMIDDKIKEINVLSKETSVIQTELF
jgi:very-short-patch-repair endonuclease